MAALLAQIIDHPTGVHRKLKRRVESVLAPAFRFAHEITEHNARRKRPRTWKDSTSNTMFANT
jgi:hypothetical protein